jgi:hypothetical protein
MKKLFKEIKEEDDKYARGENLPDYYIQSRQKRFVQLFSLADDKVGTFMGAFNAYEIQQLKSKFNNLHSGQNMLVRVTYQHDEDIKNILDNMQSILEVIDLMAQYNPGLLMMQIGEQLDEFKNRVTVLVNAVQQLHHRRLSMDLLNPEQMAIIHQSVQQKARDEGFNALATKLSD